MKGRTLGLLVIAAAVAASIYLQAHAAEPEQPPVTAMSVEREGDKLLAINIHDADGAVVARMQPDGTVTVSKGTPDDAARAFWLALSGYVKECSKL